jgi:hypothetical protein
MTQKWRAAPTDGSADVLLGGDRQREPFGTPPAPHLKGHGLSQTTERAHARERSAYEL